MTKEKTVDEKQKPRKETLTKLVNQAIRTHKYKPEIISAAFTYNNLLNTYEQDYQDKQNGKTIPKRLTTDEFNKIINDYIKRKL